MRIWKASPTGTWEKLQVLASGLLSYDWLSDCVLSNRDESNYVPRLHTLVQISCLNVNMHQGKVARKQ